MLYYILFHFLTISGGGWGSMMDTQMVLRLPHRHMICGTSPSHSYTKVCHLWYAAECMKTHTLPAGPFAYLIYTTAWTVDWQWLSEEDCHYWLLGHWLSNHVWNQSKDIETCHSCETKLLAYDFTFSCTSCHLLDGLIHSILLAMQDIFIRLDYHFDQMWNNAMQGNNTFLGHLRAVETSCKFNFWHIVALLRIWHQLFTHPTFIYSGCVYSVYI